MQEIVPITSAPPEARLPEPLLDRVRRLVISGRVQPGDLLAEAFLADEFAVSRTPIREALKQLEREGLVEIRPRVGTFVRKPTGREIQELFQVKESLEGLAASLLARRGNVPELRRLERNIADEKEAVRMNDHDAYADLVDEFHRTLVEGADNQKLSEHYELLMNQLAYHRIVVQTLEQPGRLKASRDEHRAIVAAIRSKDPFASELATRRHVSASSQIALLSQALDDYSSSESLTRDA
ncbi:MAG: GntR family transcriptional regulator [Microbacteriaceae bacterium]|nr:MAG: GntR family transcriptional regulator [Microbacteriaceae bacterium]